MSPELTYEQIRDTLTGPSRSMRWYIIPWTGCPECGDAVASPAMPLSEMHPDDPPEDDGLGVYEDDPAVCTACRRVWSWIVDEDAWINDQREPGEDVPRVEQEAMGRILEEAGCVIRTT
jgi:hypothetical protein